MIEIRPASINDIEAIQHVARTSWIDTYQDIYPMDYIHSFLNQAYSSERLEQSIVRDEQLEARRFLVAISPETDDVIGYVHVMEEQDGTFELMRLYLLPELKGRGIGTSLLDEVSRLNQINSLKAWVEEQNHETRPFYEARGFHIIGEEIETNDGFTTKLICYMKRI